MDQMLSAIAFVLSIAGSREPSLLKRATKIMDIPRTWAEGVLTQGNYYWWSSTRLVAFLVDPSGNSTLDRKQLYDLRGHAVMESVPEGLRYGAVTSFSPDRKWSTESHWNGMQITWTVFDVWTQKPMGSWTMMSHTSQPYRSEYRGYASPYVQWSADGKSIYQVETWPDNSSLLAQVTERPLDDLSNGHAYPAAHSFGWDVDLIIHDGKALARQYNLANAVDYPMTEWVLASPSTTLKQWKLHAPGGRVFIDSIPSPDMSKAVWTMGLPSTKVGGVGSHGYPYYAVSLWVSGLHGENMRELGAIPFRSRKYEELEDYYQHFGGIQWNPDGKHVSFVYMRKLYWIEA